jgi:alpha-galactosidase
MKDDLNNKVIEFKNEEFTLRDIWSHKEVGTTKKTLVTELPGRDVLMLRLTPIKK